MRIGLPPRACPSARIHTSSLLRRRSTSSERTSVEGLWIRPQQALQDAEARRRTLVFATQLNLEKLSRYGSVHEAAEKTLASPIVTVMPKVIGRTASTRTLQIPAEAGYGVSEVVVPARVPPASRA